MAAKREAVGYPYHLRKHREAADLTLEEVEIRTRTNGFRVSYSTVANLEAGRRQPSADVLNALAEAYGCDLEAIGHVLAPNEMGCSKCDGRGHYKIELRDVAA